MPSVRQIPRRNRRISFRFNVVFWFLVIVIFCLLPGVAIFGIVFRWKVGQDNDAILVDFPLNIILFLSSIITTFGAFVSCCFTKMLAVVLARQWIELPNNIGPPLGQDIATLAAMLSSPDWSSVWAWRGYLRKPQWTMFGKGSISIVILVIWMILITLGGGWFHLVSTSETWSEWVEQVPASLNSRVILDNDCLRPYMEAIWGYTFDRNILSLPCTLIEQLYARVNPGGLPNMEGNIGIANTREAFDTYSNFSSINAVAKVGNLSFLAPSNPSESLSYQASTIGMDMRCSFVNQKCLLWVFNSKHYPLNENVYEAGYDCSPAAPQFKGYLTGTNTTLLSNINDTLRYQYGSPENPFLLGVGTLNTANVTFESGLDLNVSDNANAIPPLGGAGRTYTKFNNLFAMMLCNGSVYNVTYSYRNGTYEILGKTVADRDLSWLITGPMVTGSALPFPVKAVAAAMDLATSAATAKANSVSDLETFMAEGISQVGMAFASGVFSGAPSLQESLLRVIIVSKIPISAFVVFVGLTLLLGIVGVALGIWAFLIPPSATSKSGDLIEIPAVAEYLTNISGTLKNAFDKDERVELGTEIQGGGYCLNQSKKVTEIDTTVSPEIEMSVSGGQALRRQMRSSSSSEVLLLSRD